MPETVNIRPRRLDDGAGIAAIFESLEVVRETSRIPYLPASFWANLYENASADAAILVAELDKRVVGHLGLIPDTRPRRRHVGSFGLAVHTEYQGQGIGSALVEEMLNIADNWLGLVRVELDVFAHNKPAIRLYERFGFEHEGVSRCDSLVAGQWVDTARMARLKPGS